MSEILVIDDEVIKQIIKEANKQKVSPNTFLKYLLKHYKLNFQKDINIERKVIRIEKWYSKGDLDEEAKRKKCKEICKRVL